MDATVESVVLLGVFVIGLLFSKAIYRWSNGLVVRVKLKKLGYEQKDLNFSYDRVVYTISLPTNRPDIMGADKGDFRFVEEYDSWIYPQLSGVRIELNQEQENPKLIAYLPIEQFRLPLLDQLLVDRVISGETYRRICIYKLILPSTRNEMIDEVYKQIHNKRFS